MKVEFVEKRKIDSFGEIEIGDVFKLHDNDFDYFLKIDNDDVELNSFCLTDNEVVGLRSDCLIVKVNAKVVIE